MRSSEIKFSPKSMVDDFGRVFFCRRQVYRAIYPENEAYCIQLLNSGLFKELQEKGFIPETTISDFKVEGYNLILEHEKLIEIQQHEWSFEMFKKAALLTLEINELCNKHGYELKDAHTYNILFRGVNPVWVDIGSIAPIKKYNEWIALNEFLSVFYVPIQFFLQNENYIVRKLVESNFYKMQTAPFQQLWDSKLVEMIQNKPYSYKLYFRNILLKTDDFNAKINKFVRRFNKYYHKFLKKPTKLFLYMQEFENVCEINSRIQNSVLNQTNSEWSNYHNNNYRNCDDTFIPVRFKRILELIDIYCNDAKSAIDLAGNEGFFSELLIEKTKIERVILTDYDSNAIDVAFKYFGDKKENRVSVVLLNFLFTIGLEETSERLKSDIAIALAVTHHLILTQNFSIQTIFERLRLYSNKYVIVEFMPLGLWSIHTKQGEEPPKWYTQEWFEQKFKNYFTILHVEKLEDNRILYIGCF